MADGKQKGWGQRFNDWWMRDNRHRAELANQVPPGFLDYNDNRRIKGNLGDTIASAPGAIRFTLEGMTAEEQDAWNKSGPLARLSLRDGKTIVRIYENGKNLNLGSPLRTEHLDKPIEQVTKEEIHRLLYPGKDHA